MELSEAARKEMEATGADMNAFDAVDPGQLDDKDRATTDDKAEKSTAHDSKASDAGTHGSKKPDMIIKVL